jgi:hypothetical protein
MNNFRKTLAMSAALIGIVAVNFSSASAQSTEYIIFDVKGSAEGLAEKFVLGTVLKDGDKIELPEDAEVRLLDKAGEVVILTGPITGTILDEDGGTKKSIDGSNALQVIAKLMFGDADLVNNIGAARAIGARNVDDGKIQPWVPVISKPGTYCLPMDVPIFTRLDAAAKIKVTVISGSEIFNEKVWEEKENSISVSELVKEGIDRYTLFLSSQIKESSIHLLDRTNMNTTEQIAWMAERGCKLQAVQLLNEVSEKAG